MSNEIVRTQLDRSLRAGSLSELVRIRTNGGNGDTINLLVDASGSMNDGMRNGKTKMQGLQEVVTDLKSKRPLKMIAFGGRRGGAYLCDDGVPHAGGGTPLHLAIDLAKQQGFGRVIVISDGQPDSKELAMQAARNFGGQIDVVYVGDPFDPNQPWIDGEMFLRTLAESTGGSEFHGDLSQPKELSKGIIGLLVQGTPEEDEE